MSVRAKFTLLSITQHNWPAKTFIFAPAYDPSIAEDRRFSKASPSGEFKILVDNPAVERQFEIGKAYYFDITPVEA